MWLQALSTVNILLGKKLFDKMIAKNYKLIILYSGGLQKEAFFFKKPCKILSAETEWVELVNGGFNTLFGANVDLIKQAYESQDFTINF